jgi:MarR family transcriptional regulator, organic hydroperoxide resistance regulator
VELLPSATHEELAGEAWRRLTEVTFRQRRFFVTAAASFGLNPGSLKALLELDADNPVPMRMLAERWHCDASNVTWLVDQLETRQLVERQVSTTDRRVKTVVLTDAGLALRASVEAHLRLAPPELLNLDDADLALLVKVLNKI